MQQASSSISDKNKTNILEPPMVSGLALAAGVVYCQAAIQTNSKLPQVTEHKAPCPCLAKTTPACDTGILFWVSIGNKYCLLPSTCSCLKGLFR